MRWRSLLVMLAIGLFYTVYYCIVGIYAIQEGYLNYEHLFVELHK